jgi:hypothetical protein
MDDQGGAVPMDALRGVMVHSRAAAAVMDAQLDAVGLDAQRGAMADSRVAVAVMMDAQPDAVAHSPVAGKEATAAQMDVAAPAVKVVRWYLTGSILSPERDRDGEILSALPIHAHYVEIRDAPVEALNENHPVYDPARPSLVTRRVKADQHCGPASSDRRMPHLIHHSSFLPSFLPFFHASPEVLSVLPDENREHAQGARVVEPAPQCYETERCR